MKKLPIGLSSLVEIIQGGYMYIDKTRFVADLANCGKYYFLSRPRRFGKSLFLDTLKQAFLGNAELFKGLYLHDNWDWSAKYPVIHLDVGSGVVQSREQLDAKINMLLDEYYVEHEVADKYTEPSARLRYLIKELAKKYGKNVVLLIDEYDKPILDNITDNEIAIANREGLKNVYSVIKELDSSLRFVFLTGVSKFSKVSLFSGLNNLQDITLDSRFADICGYTQEELERDFAEFLKYGKVDKEKLKLWYNGYNFAGVEEQRVYNPFDILLFIANAYKYKNYWFETATPTFLIEMLSKQRQSLFEMDEVPVVEDSLASFDVGNIPLVTLMFQTGYLTIKEETDLGAVRGYTLGYPNLEVRASVSNYLSRVGTTLEDNSKALFSLSRALDAGQIDKVVASMQAMFAGIPYQWYRKNPISEYEGFYASVVYSYLTALGYATRAEDATNAGSIDLSVDCGKNILLLEFKLSKYGDAKAALQQIQAKRYVEKYQAKALPIFLLGVSFDIESRNIRDYEYCCL